MSERFEFQRTAPESLGVDSRAIGNFWDTAEKEGIDLHSFMLLRHGTVCAERWWAPHHPDELHKVWSFSKSLTSTAIGFAVREGLISLQDKLTDLFPDQLPEVVSGHLSRATVRHLLTMSCGHATESLPWEQDNWIANFLAHEFTYEPGTVFMYNTQGTNLLAAALQRRTGVSLTEYLRPRLLDPLGIGEIAIDHMSDGVEMGGAGYRLRTEDMARFMTFVANRGNWQGRQLLDREWIGQATGKQIDTVNPVFVPAGPDWKAGYGYQFWRCQPDGVFRADGMYGQFGIVFPKQDAVLVITEHTERMQDVLDMVWQILLPAFG